MKHLKLALFLLLALALAPLRAADPIESMHANCVQLMQMGLCGALRPVSDYSAEALAAPYIMYGIGPGGSTGVVTFREYLAVRGLGGIDPKDTRMCDVAAAACRADLYSPSCMVGRSLWSR